VSHLWDSGFSVRQPAWHGLATITDDHPSDWAQAREWAGLNWEVIERDLPVIRWDASGQPEIATRPNGQPLVDPDHKAIIRDDTGAKLAYVNRSYEIISMADFGRIFEFVLDEPAVRYETAGSLDEGRIVWALAYLDEPIHIGGEDSPTMPYLLLLSRHDGTGAAQLIPTSIRVICANTARMAELQGERTGAGYTFRHTKNWRDRAIEARNAIQGARTEFAAYARLSEDLYGLKINQAQMDWFVEQFLPYPPEGTFTDRVRSNIDSARDRLRLLTHEPTTHDVNGTAYGLLAMGIEYLDHVRPFKTPASYFGRSMIRPEAQKARVLSLARDAASVRA